VFTHQREGGQEDRWGRETHCIETYPWGDSTVYFCVLGFSFFFPWLFRLDASVLGGTLSVFPQGRGSGNGVIQVKVMRYDTGCIISPSNDEVYSVLFSLSVLLNFLLFAGAHQKDQEN